MPMNLRGRSLLSLVHHTPAEIDYLVDLAIDLKKAKRMGNEVQRLKGKNIALIFEKTSTRTRSAFEVGAHDQGAGTTFFESHSSQIGHKESIKDTARVLGQIFDAIEFRGFKQETVEELAAYAGVPVYNGLTEMQSMASDILLMERGRSKAVTGREHLERNDFIIEKQKAELQRIDAAKRHTERQVNFAEQELRQVKSEIRTDKLKSAATDAATAIASGVGSLFGSGKMKELGRANERLQDEVSKRDADIKKLQTHIQQMQKQHDTQIHNLREMHRQELDMKEKELSRLGRIIDKAFRWFPMFREMLRMEKLCAMLGFSREMTERLVVRKEAMKCSGKIYSEQHRRNFDVKDDVFRVENDPDDENRLSLTVNRKPIADWFREQWNRLRYGTRQPQQEERQGRGMKL